VAERRRPAEYGHEESAALLHQLQQPAAGDAMSWEAWAGRVRVAYPKPPPPPPFYFYLGTYDFGGARHCCDPPSRL